MLFNKSIARAKYPGGWKLAKVVALYKKGSRSVPDNYRPISLLNSIGKILEKVVFNQMMSFIKKHEILYSLQFGFREKHSTSHALINLTDKIKWALDNNKLAVGIFLDIEKAFDCIDHEKLSVKLEHYGFRGHILTFLRSYLTDRKQFLSMDGLFSPEGNINTGVPQGSVLGPLLFLLYINDINNATSQAEPFLFHDNCAESTLFADDTANLIIDADPTEILCRTKRTLSAIHQWYLANSLSLSMGKSYYILFHNPHQKQISINFPEKIYIGNVHIDRAKSTKYIGVIIDEQLNWGEHINKVCNSLVKLFGIFYRIRHFTNSDLARTIYFASIYSKISYGIEVYGSTTTQNLNKLQVLQNKLMKLLTKRERDFSTNRLHSELKIIKVEDIHKNSILNLVFNCIKGDPIPSFQYYYMQLNTTHEMRTRNQNNIETFRNVKNMGMKTVHHIGATLWNALDKDVQNIKTVDAFKNVMFKTTLEKYTD